MLPKSRSVVTVSVVLVVITAVTFIVTSPAIADDVTKKDKIKKKQKIFSGFILPPSVNGNDQANFQGYYYCRQK
jgi:hypothetical protein